MTALVFDFPAIHAAMLGEDKPKPAAPTPGLVNYPACYFCDADGPLHEDHRQCLAICPACGSNEDLHHYWSRMQRLNQP